MKIRCIVVFLLIFVLYKSIKTIAINLKDKIIDFFSMSDYFIKNFDIIVQKKSMTDENSPRRASTIVTAKCRRRKWWPSWYIPTIQDIVAWRTFTLIMYASHASFAFYGGVLLPFFELEKLEVDGEEVQQGAWRQTNRK